MAGANALDKSEAGAEQMADRHYEGGMVMASQSECVEGAGGGSHSFTGRYDPHLQ